jgi:hypothetical protein
LIANTNLGGDNCHRGIGVGALVGAGGSALPERWEKDLKSGSGILPLFGNG